jgi:hypothetical protein
MRQLKYERIDKGISRQSPPAHPQDPATGVFLPKLPEDFDEAAAFDRIAGGTHALTIARELKVTPQCLYMRFAGNAAYKAAQEVGTEVRLDTAEIGITEAPDPFTLARAREQFRAAFMRAGVEHSHRWGVKQPTTNVQINLVTQDVLGAAADLLKLVQSVGSTDGSSACSDATSTLLSDT